MEDKKAKLSPRQIAFVENYLANGFNGTQAAISAGYSKNTANEQAAQLLARLSIKQHINKERQKTSKKLEITRESILLKIQKVIDHVEKLLEDGMTQAPEMNVMLKGLEQQAKMLGLNEPDKLEVNLKAELIPDFGDDSDE